MMKKAMNIYVSVITEMIEFIEYHISEDLQLADLSARAGISDFHFDRIFKTVSGITLKQYVLGRKLTRALELLRNSDMTIIEIAMAFGFEYPEVFSRAVKRQFGLSPSRIRQQDVHVNEVKKAAIVERDIKSYRGTLVLKGTPALIKDMKLQGLWVKADANSSMFMENLRAETQKFILESGKSEAYKKDRFYTIVRCEGNDSGRYDVFCGRQPGDESTLTQDAEFLIPGGCYVDFIYTGDMFDIREVFIDDLYKWIMVHEAEINPNGIGMLNIYDNNYPENNKVHILIPIKTQKISKKHHETNHEAS